MRTNAPGYMNCCAAPTMLLAALLFLLFGAEVSFATPLSEMDHAMWTARDGAPQGVVELAQTRDGILWIGSDGGLTTFDGHAFNAVQSQTGEPDLPAGAVTSLRATRDGAVWIGFYEGGIVRIANHHTTIFTEADHQKLCCAHFISQAVDGSVWAVSGQTTLVRFGRDGRWHIQANPAGRSGGRLLGMFIDSSNTLWAIQGGRLYRRPLAQSAWYPTQAKVDWGLGFAEAADHSVWVSDTILDPGRGRFQHMDRFGKLLESLTDDNEVGAAILPMRDSSLVVATWKHGLRRYGAPSRATHSSGTAISETFTHLDGLSSDATRVLLIDEDGNIWVGGQRGIDRFRKGRLVPFVTKNALGEWSLCSTKAGHTWLADDSGQVDEVTRLGTKAYPNAGDGAYSITCGNDDVIRLIDNRGIWEVGESGTKALPTVPGARTHAIAQVVATSGHRLFASVYSGFGEGWLWQYQNGSWSELQGVPHDTPFVLYLDSNERLWTGYREGLIGRPLEKHGRLLTSGRPGLGTVYALLETSQGMFAAGSNGLAVLRGDHFELLTFADRTSSRGVAGLVESRNGDLWMNASRGIVHIRAVDLSASLKDTRIPVRSNLVTEGDFVGPVRLLHGHSTTARDDQGNLWFATLNGVFRFDPEFNFAGHLPTVAIKSIFADGNSPDRTGSIGPLPQTMNIQYLGVNLTAPENVTYRYRLDGLDTAWQDAGHRTEAIYTHLRPGSYTFRVMASNDSQTWTDPVSTANITVLPSFYQTNWFYLLCGSTLIVLLWLMYTLRIRTVSQVIKARADERAEERIRIARELHDTLLQGFQGLLLTFHVTAQKVARDDESKAMLERTLSVADKIIVEGRNRVSSLRAASLSDGELLGSLESAGRDIGLDGDIEFHVRRTGTAAQLNPHVAEEVYYIAREALSNAFRHSGASQINLELNYETRSFNMTCRDNGRGFLPTTDLKSGHWGLKGMLERAQRLGGRLNCESAPMQGTVILFTLVSRRAYKDQSRLAFYLRMLSPVAVSREAAQLKSR